MKMTFKAVTVITLTIYTMCAQGQDTSALEKIKEFYLTPLDISPISVSMKYKQQLKEMSFFKIGLVNLSVNSTTSYPTTSTSFVNRSLSFSAGMEFGLEFRKKISDRFTFFHGPNISFGYQTQVIKSDNPLLSKSQSKSKSKTYIMGIPYTLGILFQLNNHFLLSSELNPGFFINYNEYNSGQDPFSNYTNISTNFNLTNKLGIISLAYRI